VIESTTSTTTSEGQTEILLFDEEIMSLQQLLDFLEKVKTEVVAAGKSPDDVTFPMWEGDKLFSIAEFTLFKRSGEVTLTLEVAP
jgi:hypothetical protein